MAQELAQMVADDIDLILLRVPLRQTRRHGLIPRGLPQKKWPRASASAEATPRRRCLGV